MEPSAAVLVIPSKRPRSCAKPATENVHRGARVLGTIVLFPENAGIELGIKFTERRFSSGASEWVAHTEPGRGIDQGRVVRRRYGDMTDQQSPPGNSFPGAVDTTRPPSCRIT